MDDGYFPIARNLLLWLAKTKLSSSQRAVIDVILCQTYGFYEHASPKLQKLKKRRIKAQIPFSTFIKHTWLDKASLSRAIKSLKQMKLITQDKSTKPYTYSFNVEVSHWPVDIFRKNHRELTNMTTEVDSFVNNQLSKSSTIVDEYDNKNSHNPLTSKDNHNPKEIIKEKYINKSIKERDNYSKSYLFKNQKRHQKEPVRIGEVIKSII